MLVSTFFIMVVISTSVAKSPPRPWDSYDTSDSYESNRRHSGPKPSNLMSKYSISSILTFLKYNRINERNFYAIQILFICKVLPRGPPMTKRGPSTTTTTTVIPWTTTGQMPGNDIIILFSTVVK